MRSRTPTGTEMNQQNSLEVPPPQVRSASFDEVKFKQGRRESTIVRQSSTTSSAVGEYCASSGVSVIGSQGNSLEVPGSSSSNTSFLLRVPYLGPKRSKSFDSGCGDEDDPDANKKSLRPASFDKGIQCVHCNYLEIMGKRKASRLALEFSDISTSREDDDFEWENSSDDLNEVICGIKVTLSPNSPSSATPNIDIPPPRMTRSNSPKLERQPAVYCMPSMATDLSSQENSVDFSDGGYSHHGSFGYLGSSSEYGDAETSGGTPTGEVLLNVPTKLDRAVSLDMTYSASYPTSFTEPRLSVESNPGLTRSISLQPPQAIRSKSIDIELPTDLDGDYKVLVTSPKVTK